MDDTGVTERYGEAMRSISSSFSADFGLIDLLHHVVEECRTVLDVADVGIVLADSGGQRRAAARFGGHERTILVGGGAAN